MYYSTAQTVTTGFLWPRKVHKFIKVWPNWPTLFVNMSNLTCSPTMLPNLATVLANKFRSKNVRSMFVQAQHIFANILLFDRMLSNLATMVANNSTQSGKRCARIMR